MSKWHVGLPQSVHQKLSPQYCFPSILLQSRKTDFQRTRKVADALFLSTPCITLFVNNEYLGIFPKVSHFLAPISDFKKAKKLRKLRENLKVAQCRHGIFVFVSRSKSICAFSRCLQVFSYFLKVTQSFSQGARFLKVLAPSVFLHLEKTEGPTPYQR